MKLALHTATAAELDAINARYAAIGFLPSAPGELNVIATVDGRTAGQGRIVPIDANSGELGGIYVLPPFEGRGVARRIVEFLIGQSALSTLYCLPFAELQDFYGAMGFVPVKDQRCVPKKVLHKLDWCKTAYDTPVLLLARIAP